MNFFSGITSCSFLVILTFIANYMNFNLQIIYNHFNFFNSSYVQTQETTNQIKHEILTKKGDEKNGSLEPHWVLLESLVSLLIKLIYS